MPEQFPQTSKMPAGQPQSGPEPAKHAWKDVLDRAGASADMVTGEGLGAMLLMMSGLQPCPWGDAVKGKATDLKTMVGGRDFRGTV